MQSRMNNPAMVVPEAMKALQELSSAVGECGVPKSTLGLVELRASQINGCGVCVDMHARPLRQAGEPMSVFLLLRRGATHPTSAMPNARRTLSRKP